MLKAKLNVQHINIFSTKDSRDIDASRTIIIEPKESCERSVITPVKRPWYINNNKESENSNKSKQPKILRNETSEKNCVGLQLTNYILGATSKTQVVSEHEPEHEHHKHIINTYPTTTNAVIKDEEGLDSEESNKHTYIGVPLPTTTNNAYNKYKEMSEDLRIRDSLASNISLKHRPKNDHIDPYNFGPPRIGITDPKWIRSFFQQDLSNFTLKPGDYLDSAQAAKYSMWLYFTAKRGISLRQLRALGLRDLKNNTNKASPSSQHSKIFQSANFSYCCQRCNSVLFVAKRKVPGSYNDGVNTKAPCNVWVIRSIIDHNQDECHKAQEEIKKQGGNFSIWNKDPEKLTCAHTADLITTVQNQFQLTRNELVKSVVGILQDTFYGEYYENSKSVSYIKKDDDGSHKICLKDTSKFSMNDLKRKQSLMFRLVRKRIKPVS